MNSSKLALKKDEIPDYMVDYILFLFIYTNQAALQIWHLHNGQETAQELYSKAVEASKKISELID